jgi:hypothetical protein
MFKLGVSFCLIHQIYYNLNQACLSLSYQPALLFIHPLRESLKRAVVSALDFRRESAGGQFFHRQVEGDALAAFALAGAWFISAVAVGFVFTNITVHFHPVAALPVHVRKARCAVLEVPRCPRTAG